MGGFCNIQPAIGEGLLYTKSQTAFTFTWPVIQVTGIVLNK